MFTRLGARLRRFVRDIWEYLREELHGLARDVFSDLNPLAREKAAIQEIIAQVAENPEEALAAVYSIAALPTPWTDLTLAMMLNPVISLALEFSLAPKRAERDLGIFLSQVDKRTGAQILASLPYLPQQQKAQIEASLPYIPTQTLAQWEATKPLVEEQVRVNFEATLKILVEQTLAQWEATKPLLVDQARANFEATLPIQDEQAAARWNSEKPLVPEQTAVNTQASLDANINVRPGNIPTQPLISAFFRGIIDEPFFRNVLRRAGYPEEQIDAFIKGSQFYPSPQDLITWVAREVFEPDSIEKYGLADEFELLNLDLFAGAGISEEQARNYWIAHWQHASFGQVSEMFAKDVLLDPTSGRDLPVGSDAWRLQRAQAQREIYEWYRLVEVPPYWRDRLTETIYRPPSRIDIRRAWGFGAATDDDVRRAAADLGYRAEYVEVFLTFVKVSETVPDLLAAYSKGWYTQDEVLDQLRGLGLDEEAVQRIYRTKVQAPAAAERTAKERDLTKAEIVKGVKVGLINRNQGLELLGEYGLDPFEAEFVLDVNLGVATGSPHTYPEFLHWARMHRRLTAPETPQVPRGVIEIGELIHDLQAELETVPEGDEHEGRRAELRSEIRRLELRQDALCVECGIYPREERPGA